MYYIMKIAKYGGGIVSKHKTEEQAEKAMQKLPKKAVGIIESRQIRELPFAWQAVQETQLAK